MIVGQHALTTRSVDIIVRAVNDVATASLEVDTVAVNEGAAGRLGATNTDGIPMRC